MIFYIAKDISCCNYTSHFSPVYVNQICLALLIDVPSQLPEAHKQGKPCDLENTIWATQLIRKSFFINMWWISTKHEQLLQEVTRSIGSIIKSAKINS